MNKRRVGYVVVAVLLVAGLVVAYFVLRDPGSGRAELRPTGSARFTWADGTELRPDVPSEQLLIAHAKRELLAAGMFENALTRNGYTVTLTVDQVNQNRGEQVLAEARAGEPGNLRMALVAVDPRTGRIVAWNGYQREHPELDYGQVWANPGQLFAAFDLVAQLHGNRGLDDTYDGTSPRTFGNIVVHNHDDVAPCGTRCTVAQGVSLNTVLADLAFNSVGTPAVARAAVEAGIPANVGARSIPLTGRPGSEPSVNLALGEGDYQARPVDIAGAYATFAANGTRRAPHLVARVTDPAANAVVFDPEANQAASQLAFAPGDPGFNARIARNVTEALLPTAAQFPCGESQVCAGIPSVHACVDVNGKTTKADSCATWMAGYAPQLSTAVWLGTDDNTALRDTDGNALDSTVPAKAWQKFTTEYLKGKPVEQFPPFVAIGKGPH